MNIRILSRLLLAMALAASSAVAETFEEIQKRTDMANADAVFELGTWCRDNNKPAQARKFYLQVIKIDKDHEAARTALGQIKVGERWVAADLVRDANTAGTANPSGSSRQASGPGPTAAQISWDLSIPKDPDPNSTWLDQSINALSGAGADSNAMDAALSKLWPVERGQVPTPAHEVQIASGISRLCAAMARPTFTDCYAASVLAQLLVQNGRQSQAKQLLPFIARASERTTDGEKLSGFTYAASLFKDRRLVPRLIEILEHGSGEAVRSDAASALSVMTGLPAKTLTPASAKAWWDLNHNVSEQQIFSEQLRSSDPLVQVAACEALYDLRDRSIVPVLIKLLRGSDPAVSNRAIKLIRRITGMDWQYDPVALKDPAARGKRVDLMEKWWKEEGSRFQWIEDRNAPAAEGVVIAAKDPAAEWVAKLASTAGNEADSAEANLTSADIAAVPALIGGLDHANVIIRRRCHSILRSISKQDIAFDARSDDATVRAKGIADWTAWATISSALNDEAAAP